MVTCRLRQDHLSLEVQLRQLKQGMHSELDTAGWRLAPVARRLREALGPAEDAAQAQDAAPVRTRHFALLVLLFHAFVCSVHADRVPLQHCEEQQAYQAFL